MNQQTIINATKEYIHEALEGEGSGHDWWHIYRVWKNAQHIGSKENVDMFTVELAALLHDIADYKMHNGDDTIGPRVAREWLESLGVDQNIAQHVADIIKGASFKGKDVNASMKTLEGQVVQDADRLDAMGAIGIARNFAYGGYKELPLYDPDLKNIEHANFESYKNPTPAINHFYEKLLLLKDLMNTETAKTIAIERHQYMKEYLERFYKEWEGEL